MIIIDIHEPDKIKDIGITKDLGYDIYIGGKEEEYFIERKTISDFISSLYSKRIFYQLDRLKEMCDNDNKKALLLLEGSIYKLSSRKYCKIKEELFYMTLLSIQKNGIYIIHTDNIGDTIKFLKSLDKKVGKANKNKVVYQNKNTLKTSDERIKLLCSIKGIGYKTAKKLLDKYGDIKTIFNLSEDEWINDIGNKKGKFTYELLNGK